MGQSTGDDSGDTRRGSKASCGGASNGVTRTPPESRCRGRAADQGARHHPPLKSALLIWKAQAQLALGRAEHALPSASRLVGSGSEPSRLPLDRRCMEALGDLDGAEELLRMGWRLFPEAIHIPVQLAVILSDQGRHPEALDILVEIPLDHPIPEDFRSSSWACGQISSQPWDAGPKPMTSCGKASTDIRHPTSSRMPIPL